MRNGAGSVGSMLAPGSYVTRVDASGNEYLARVDGPPLAVCNDPGCKSCAAEYAPVVAAARQAGGMNDAIKTLEKYVRGRLDAIGAPGAKITFVAGPESVDLDLEVIRLQEQAKLNETLSRGTISFHEGPMPKAGESCPGCRYCRPVTASMMAKVSRPRDPDEPIFGSTKHATWQLAERNGDDRPLYKPLADAANGDAKFKRFIIDGLHYVAQVGTPEHEKLALEWALQQLDKLCTDLEMGTVSRVDTLLERLQKTWIGVSGGAQ